MLRSPGNGPLCSLYDPHPVPGDRSWFEGYYTRIVPDGWDGSLAVVDSRRMLLGLNEVGKLALPHGRNLQIV